MHRRDWLRALGTGMGAGLLPTASWAEALAPWQSEPRRLRAYDVRVQAAVEAARRQRARLDANGDETRVPGYAAMYAKGLPHDVFGFVLPAAYEHLVRALDDESGASLEQVPLGGTLRLVSPQAAFAVGMDGLDPAQIEVPPPASFASDAMAFDAMHVYWAARLRDLPFDRYAGDALVARALAEVPDIGARPGDMTSAFRLPLPGVERGPYVSQFLLRPVPMGANALYQRVLSPAAGVDYGAHWDTWLALQNGQQPDVGPREGSAARYIVTGRDLAAWSRHDYPAQAGLHAALILEAVRAPVQASHPYVRSRNQSGYVTFGLAQVTDLAARVALHALRAAWLHKWVVHRRLRPEAFGGRVEAAVSGSQVVVLPHQRFLQSQALAESRRAHGTALLPLAFPEGAPLHPSYPAAHAAAVGASVTVLKACYAEAWVLPGSVRASADGRSLERDETPLTIGGELNKLASNVAMGRVFAGVQWPEDALAGLRLGEDVALGLLRELRATWREDAGAFTVTRFNGVIERI
jgi:hypothetical protein